MSMLLQVISLNTVYPTEHSFHWAVPGKCRANSTWHSKMTWMNMYLFKKKKKKVLIDENEKYEHFKCPQRIFWGMISKTETILAKPGYKDTLNMLCLVQLEWIICYMVWKTEKHGLTWWLGARDIFVSTLTLIMAPSVILGKSLCCIFSNSTKWIIILTVLPDLCVVRICLMFVNHFDNEKCYECQFLSSIFLLFP